MSRIVLKGGGRAYQNCRGPIGAAQLLGRNANVLTGDLGEIGRCDVIDAEAANLAATLYQRDYGVLVRAAARPWP